MLIVRVHSIYPQHSQTALRRRTGDCPGPGDGFSVVELADKDWNAPRSEVELKAQWFEPHRAKMKDSGINWNYISNDTFTPTNTHTFSRNFLNTTHAIKYVYQPSKVGDEAFAGSALGHAPALTCTTLHDQPTCYSFVVFGCGLA